MPVPDMPLKDGSAVVERANDGGTATDDSEDAHFYKPPPGWSVERIDSSSSSSGSISGINHGDGEVAVDGNGFPFSPHREFNDDSGLDFDPREEFAGRRPGHVFRLGSKGVGYYEDRRI